MPIVRLEITNSGGRIALKLRVPGGPTDLQFPSRLGQSGSAPFHLLAWR
jgi:hypothetical protein